MQDPAWRQQQLPQTVWQMPSGPHPGPRSDRKAPGSYHDNRTRTHSVFVVPSKQNGRLGVLGQGFTKKATLNTKADGACAIGVPKRCSSLPEDIRLADSVY